MASPIKSPGQPWRKPSDIMRLRQLKSKKKILDRRMEDHRPTVPQSSSSSVDKTPDNEPRINPFRSSPWKRRRRNDGQAHHPRSPPSLLEAETASCDSTLFQLLHTSTGQTSSSITDTKIVDSVVQSQCLRDEQRTVTHTQLPEDVDASSAAITDRHQWHSQMPFDWSLKTSLRLTSVQPFPWNSGRLTTLEEASGITGFVRCVPLGYDPSVDSRQFTLDTSPNGQLFQCCQVWMHPALPWLKLFPRHQTRAVSTTTTTVQVHPQIQESLQADWTESFGSLFHLLRARQCPYFYVCAQLFTVLFRAPGIGTNPRMHALITPTTRGFRSALTEEGVQFTLPLCEAVSSSIDDEITLDDETDINGEREVRDGGHQHEDVVNWLKSVGVDNTMLAQLDRDPSTVNKQKEIDYRPQSLVCVEDGDVHALFNFLLNSKSCVTNSGPFTGIPPTLLAPVAFIGSTLRPLKMRQQQAQKTDSPETLHVFDVTGPILPHTVHYLDELLQTRSTQSAAAVSGAFYEIQLSTLESTASFSAYSLPNDGDVPLSVFGLRSLSDCGLSAHVLAAMCSQRKGKVLRRVSVSANGYRWTTSSHSADTKP